MQRNDPQGGTLLAAIMGIFLRTLLLAVLGARALPAQAPLAAPEDFGIVLPIGVKAHLVEDRRVLVPSPERDTPEVARVFLDVGDRYVVTLPDGALRSLPKTECTVTDRPFESDEDDLAKDLKRQFPGFKVRTTRRYICVYNGSDNFRQGVMRILETMYPALEKYFQRKGFDVARPETPLIVVIFKNKKEFLRYRDMPENILAYYNTVDNRVFLYQHSSINKDAPVIAAKQAISTTAHEGVHQILHNIGVQQRLAKWPLWITEGLAEYFAPTTTGVRSKWKGVGKPNDLRMRELFEHLKQTPQVGRGHLVHRLITARQLNSADYAVAWALTHYLQTKRQDAFFEYLHAVSKTAPLDEAAGELARFGEHFGTDFAKLERAMIAHVRGLPYVDPLLNQPYYLVTALAGSRRLAAITPSRDLTEVKQQLMGKLGSAQRVRARFAVRAFPNRPTAEAAMLLFTRSK